MGILGNWITNKTAKPFYARRIIKICKQVLHAEAKVCGLGQFHFYMDGRIITN